MRDRIAERVWRGIGVAAWLVSVGVVLGDNRLPVREGLELWLDATQLAAAAGSAVSVRQPVSVWPDASGRRRDLLQEWPAFRPVLVPTLRDGTRAPHVVFDGQDDHLVNNDAGLRLEGSTWFLVAAPQTNAGMFRGLVAMNGRHQNDYTSGMNIDLGGAPSAQFGSLNVEGRGFGGAVNLLREANPFRTFRCLTIVISHSTAQVSVWANGQEQQSRPRSDEPIIGDELWLGCRCYRNEPGPPYAVSFFDGAIAEVLLYRRALSAGERKKVEDYLVAKHAALLQSKAREEPPLAVLVPGFEVRELPLALPNLNDLAFAPDGRLFAAGYDGRILRLVDSDGDGLEDRHEVIWSDPSLRTPISIAWRREGLYVTANSKVILLKDDDGDGKMDREEIVATGWVPDDGKTGGGVDALGLAFDSQGRLYFGLGCADYTNAYRLKDGKPHYDLRSERGTILQVSADRLSREIFCTGIRFPYSLAFNRRGDLFATDQEGATWLPGGNPLDELNHIQKGRHYGFPPRHPTYLPQVIDEPPVAVFAPQHQSTCGLVFNEPDAGKRGFGPESWLGDAFVAGYSRGKIWRVRVVKTAAGYVGKPTLFAAASLLTLDVGISPSGEMTVICHSGQPDWGTGPKGPGRLFRIRYRDPAAPQPVAAWAAGPLEVKVAFDRPVAASMPQRLEGRSIEFGSHVRAGDRFEKLKPPYAVVQAESNAPRGMLGIAAAELSADRRTLRLRTEPHPWPATYALLLPGESTTPPIELDYSLYGVQGLWTPRGSSAVTWSGWLPALDGDVNQAMLAGSSEHETLWKHTRQDGMLVLLTRLHLPDDNGSIEITSNRTFVAQLGGRRHESKGPGSPTYHASLPFRKGDARLDCRLEVSTGGSDTITLHAAYRTASDATLRPIPLERYELPWSRTSAPPPAPPTAPAEIVGGDWHRGRDVFQSKEARCAECHRFHGQGGTIGPDLSNLRSRDPGSVLRDITQPSAVINPDFVSYTLSLHDGRVLIGVVRAHGVDELRVFDAQAKETVIRRRDIEAVQPNAKSLMPDGIDKTLSSQKLKDLVTFLTAAEPESGAPETGAAAAPGLGGTVATAATSAAPTPGLTARHTPEPPSSGPKPQPRSRAELARVLDANDERLSDPLRPLNIVLVAGPKDHGPNEHDYPAWQAKWKALLAKGKNVRVSTAWEWPSTTHWELADLIVFFYWNHAWTPERYQQLDAFFERGGGVLAFHSAVIADKEAEALAQRIGLAFQPGRSKYRHGPLVLDIRSDHEITRNFGATKFYDESYWNFAGEVTRVRVLATSTEEGKPQPMVWTYEPAKGRVACSILGHYVWTFDDPLNRVLMLRAMAWAARDSMGRFYPLITDGALIEAEASR